MYYSIKHTTQFRYRDAVSENVTEVRMHPRSEGRQRCLDFNLRVNPKAHVSQYRDYSGNIVHHFDIPRTHNQLSILARAIVEILEGEELPETLGPETWADCDVLANSGDHYFDLAPSIFTEPTELLRELADQFDVTRRRQDPLSLLRELNASINKHFDYAQQSTRVDSPIDVALAQRKGVCQDFAHVMIAIVRTFLELPCRYVSGYLFHAVEKHDRSAADATHAWVEVLLPELGWVGFDPTNNLIAGERHIRAAVGRDYSDVPPTKGVLKGSADSEMTVAVEVKPCTAPVEEVEDSEIPGITIHETAKLIIEHEQQQQQQ